MRVGLLVALLVSVALSGCMEVGLQRGSCDAVSLVEGGVLYLETYEVETGGVSARLDGPADPRVTAWVLLAASLADRAGPAAVAFDGREHALWLADQAPGMLREGTGVDSAANNASLLRSALQAWGHSGHGVWVDDPAHPDVRTLAEAWDARLDNETGFYGSRLNEHLFAGFAARVFTHDLGLLERLGTALASQRAQQDADLYEVDAWYAAYARALLGPQPVDAALAEQLDEILESRQLPDGSIVPFEGAPRSDASTTAAALLAWGAQGRTLEDAQVGAAVDWLCALQQDNGGIPFASDMRMLHVKTTAEVVIAVSLLLEPIDWPQPPPL
jgi:hypothetical protein